MAEQSVSNFAALINNQLDSHTLLSEQLIHITELLNFTLSSDLNNLKATELHAQLLSLSKALEAATELNQHMLDRLAEPDLIALALESLEKQST